MTGTTNELQVVKQPWEEPILIFRGVVGDVLQGGGGKLSITAADPGESRCEKPHQATCEASGR